MADAWLSVLGLYQYHPALFDSFALPDGVNRDVMIDSIMMECAELEVLFPDAGVFQYMIGSWSRSRVDAWTRIADALSVDYNVLDNYDITRTYTTKEVSENSENEETEGKLDSNSTTNSEGTSTQSQAAFNEGLRENAQTTTHQDVSSTAGQEQTGSRNLSRNGNVVREHTETEKGDNSVRSTQYMLTQELDFRKTDIYQIITEEFRNKFCLEVY